MMPNLYSVRRNSPTEPAATRAEVVSPISELAALRLSAKLHASLDPRTVVGIFAEELKRGFGVEGVCYSARGGALEIRVGCAAINCHSLTLMHGETMLGQLTLSRQARFRRTEAESIKQFSVPLAAALNNAHQHETVRQNAVIDTLTGCANQTVLAFCANREIARARRHGGRADLLLIDIDHLGVINGFYGSEAGDRVLARTGRVLQQTCRDSDGAFRIGGGSFAVLLTDTGPGVAELVAARILAGLEESAVDYQQDEVRFTASCGVAALTPGEHFEAWFGRATRALAQAKDAGRDQVAIAADGLRHA